MLGDGIYHEGTRKEEPRETKQRRNWFFFMQRKKDPSGSRPSTMAHNSRTDDADDFDRPRREKSPIWSQLMGGILLVICSTSLGYGWAQSTTTRELVVSLARLSLSVDHMRELQQTDRKALDNTDLRISRDISDMRAAATEHMKVTVNLIQKMVEQNQELIAYLRARVVPTNGKP